MEDNVRRMARCRLSRMGMRIKIEVDQRIGDPLFKHLGPIANSLGLRCRQDPAIVAEKLGGTGGAVAELRRILIDAALA